MDGPDEPEPVDTEAESAPETAPEPLETERLDHGGSAKRKRSKRRQSSIVGGKDYVKTFAAALVAALVTGTAAVIASSISANGAYQAAMDQQQATRKATLDDEARIKRSQIYAEFLDAANDLELKSNSLADEHSRAVSSIPQVSTDQNITNAWQESRQKFQSELNQVFVYGSKAAWESAAYLSSTLPSGVGSTVRFDHVREEPFKVAYVNFQTLMRCEVPAVPVSPCI